MTKTSTNKDKIKFRNSIFFYHKLYKSFFSELKDTSCDISDDQVIIYKDSNKDSDPPSVELKIKNDLYEVYFWDGYSLADKFTSANYDKALLQFKKFSKKLAKSLKRF